MRRSRKALVLAALYLVQDIGVSFFFIALVAILRQRGLSLERLALVNLLGFAWTGHFLLGPLVDRYGVRRFGHYRGWLVATQVLMVAGLVGMALLDPATQLPWVLAVMTAVMFVTGAHQVAINGLAVRLLTPAERGTANGLQVSAISVSIVIGSGGSLLLYARVGWSATLACLAAVFLIPLGVLATFREPEPTRTAGTTPGLGSLVSFLRRPGAARWVLLVIPMYMAGSFVAQSVVSPMLLDAGWSLSRVGLVQNTLGPLAATAVGLGAGLLLRRLGRRNALLAFGLAQAVMVLGLLPLAQGRGGLALTTGVVVGVVAFEAAMFTAVFTVAMDIARPDSAATDYALQTTMTSVLRLVATSTALALAGLAGYLPLIVAASVVGGAGALTAAAWARARHQRLTSTTTNSHAERARLRPSEAT